MKVKIEKESPLRVIPKIGEYYHHTCDTSVYRRISENPVARCTIKNENNSEGFLCYDLRNGTISWTSFKSDNIEILKPVGEMVFVVEKPIS